MYISSGECFLTRPAIPTVVLPTMMLSMTPRLVLCVAVDARTPTMALLNLAIGQYAARSTKDPFVV